jgi:hypothetical protein
MRTLSARTLFYIFCFGFLIDPVGFRHASSVRWVWIAQGIFALILAGMLVRHLHNYYVKQIKAYPGRSIDAVDPVPAREAYKLQRVAEKSRPTARQARIFAMAIMEPAELRQRVAEYYTPGQRTLEQAVEVEVQIPKWLLSPAAKNGNGRENGETDVKFPLLVLPKGVFNDNLEASSEDRPVCVLSYREYLQLAAGILRIFLASAYGIRDGAKFPPLTPDAADKHPIAVEHRALCEIIRRTQATKQAKKAHATPISAEAIEVAETLVRQPPIVS